MIGDPLSPRPETIAAIDGNTILPFALLGGLWLAILWQVVRGLRTGRMTEFRRDSAAARRSSSTFDRSRHPRQFWLLFGFYVVVLVAIPIMCFVAVNRR